MDVSRETPDVTTKPKCYDLSNMLVRMCTTKNPRSKSVGTSLTWEIHPLKMRMRSGPMLTFSSSSFVDGAQVTPGAASLQSLPKIRQQRRKISEVLRRALGLYFQQQLLKI